MRTELPRYHTSAQDVFVDSRSEKRALQPHHGPSRTGQRMSLRAAIDAACRACIHDPHAAGTWREQVAACTSRGCPLYLVRPLPKK